MDGGNLNEYLKANVKVRDKKPVIWMNITRNFTAQLMDCVEFLGKNNICHRDIKPLNILLSSPRQGKMIYCLKFNKNFNHHKFKPSAF